ncbi:MAG: alpha/beta fold hydrolase [Anaerolineae bacterium]|nr:alpha/beta fold hydrolase [Anaerolineae bacterium]
MTRSLPSQNTTAGLGPATRVPITSTSESHTLAGTLHKPAGDGPFPTIVVLHSASAGKQDYPLYLHLAQAMNEIGVAVYIYDRRGEDIPPKERIHPGYMALGRDGLAAIQMLKTRDDVAETHIGLWGVSQGGWIAPAAFGQSQDDIAFLILVSSSGVGPAQQMAHAVPQVLRAVGYGEAVAEAGAHLRQKVDAYYRCEVTREAAQALIDQYKDEPWFEHVYIAESLPEAVVQTGWDNETRFDPWPVFSGITVPILLLYGENDPWIPVEESMAIWRDALAQAGNDDVELHQVPRTGHLMLIDEPAYVDEKELRAREFSPVYTRLIQDFVRRVVTR